MFTRSLHRPGLRTLLLTGVAGAALIGSGLAAAPAGAATAAPAATPAAGSTYLALGDSIAFGYQEANATTPPNYLDASSLVGYPEDIGTDLNLQVANAACPGETTASYRKAGAGSNGCENSPDGQGGFTGPGYRQAYLLHEDYAGTQAAYARAFLKQHPQTALVTLQLGANDGLICQETTPDHCQSELGTVAAKIGSNINIILGELRGADHYTGQIVLVQYYSLDYTNSTDNLNSEALNYELTRKAAKYGAVVANEYSAFQTASAGSGGQPCAAGLLVPLSGGGCGIHPSPAGQELLAQTVETALANSSSTRH